MMSSGSPSGPEAAEAYFAMLDELPLVPDGWPLTRERLMLLAQAARAAGLVSDAAIYLSSLRRVAVAQPMLEDIQADAQVADLLRVLWGPWTLSYALVLDDPGPPGNRTMALAEVLLSQGKRVFLIPVPDHGGPSIRPDPGHVEQALPLKLPSGTARVILPRAGENGMLALSALLCLIHKNCCAGRDLVVGYATSRMEELTYALHDFLVLYSNPALGGDHKFACFMGQNLPASPDPDAFSIHGSETLAAPLFSIAIPTRNNPHCLEFCLRTILEQDFTDFEIVIGDNSTIGDHRTCDLVKRLDSEKIRYFRTPRVLCLPDSFEFTHARCRGDFVLGLGSDDGLLFHGLEVLAKVLAGAGRDVDAAKFDFLFYGWPSATPNKFKHFFRVPPTIVKGAEGPPWAWVDSREMLDRYLGLTTLFHNVPNGYGYSVLSRRLLGKLKKTMGRIFPANSQDTYTSTYVLASTDSFLRIDYPITAFAVSGNSVGSQFQYGGEEQTRIRHMFELSEIEMGIEEFVACDPAIKKGLMADVCGFLSQELLNAENVADAVKRKVLPREVLDKIDWRRYFAMCLDCVYENDPFFKKKMNEIWEKIRRRNRPEIEAWFLDGFLNNPDFKGVPVPLATPFRYGLLPNGVLYLNAADFGVENVYDAAVLFRKIAHI